MRKLLLGLATLSITGGAVMALPGAATAQPQTVPPGTSEQVSLAADGTSPDDLIGPLQEKARALRERAVTEVLTGDAEVENRNGSQVVRLDAAPAAAGVRRQADDGQYVELGRQVTDRIFVVLAEFGDQRHPSYPDRDTNPSIPGPTTFSGPLHNRIPKPAADDNSTVWQPDYDKKHYEDLYFGDGESLRSYYEAQSSGRYSVEGKVTDWVKVPYNEARYGRSNGYPCPSNNCGNVYRLLSDAVTAWVAQQKAAGRTDAQIKADVAEFDQWDRYDFDGDGDFNEPDGYIDHFQIVHAGGDQADGDPQQGEDAIWSHRSFVDPDALGLTGPDGNRLGGTQIGTTGLWVGDYTMQPENGGMDVFAHEYGHDLGLPDDYDVSNGGGSPVEWWSLMAQSRLSGEGEPIGVRAGDLGAWQKLMLGWLDYEEVTYGRRDRVVELGPQEYNTERAQAVVVGLPLKTVVTQLPKPRTGSYEWWSGTANSVTRTLTRSGVAVPAGQPKLTFQAAWNIEDCGADPCDYAFVEVDDGNGFTPIAGSITNAAENNAIDGVGDWTPASFDLSAYAGKTVSLRFRYTTDPAVEGQDPAAPAGLFLDDIAIAGSFEDGAESAANGWSAAGFRRTTGTETASFPHFYIAGHRSYVSYDQYLKTGPYNFGWASTRPDHVEHFPYQEGLLVSYWDTSQTDNNVSQHPGQGRNLIVDAHPAPLFRSDSKPFRARVQLYDAPFGLDKTDSFALHIEGERSRIPKLPANPVFDDTQNYFDPVQLDHGVKLPATGVKITVEKRKKTAMTIRVTTP
ncbi:immune inhibitor A domain-containing protein [Kineosporia succinea]|uniref:Immune inhibitor A n=1 Tax=Kineosporia succinea TaxID=84632 RepID=A0ABT9P5J8_9ACTN|nr:immune inhibitor A domain-containing protein [Kineosporia succinea]MDP9827821.1 immune inhibitor A [Kineosporia succinea]